MRRKWGRRSRSLVHALPPVTGLRTRAVLTAQWTRRVAPWLPHPCREGAGCPHMPPVCSREHSSDSRTRVAHPREGVPHMRGTPSGRWPAQPVLSQTGSEVVAAGCGHTTLCATRDVTEKTSTSHTRQGEANKSVMLRRGPEVGLEAWRPRARCPRRTWALAVHGWEEAPLVPAQLSRLAPRHPISFHCTLK